MRLHWADGKPLTAADRDAVCDPDFLRTRVLGQFMRSRVLVVDDAWNHVHGDACDAPECCPNREETI